MSFLEFLNAKPLYYDVIDYTRMPRIYESVKASLKLPKLIHLVGTNGKGTTGRFVASALRKAGFMVGHYSSPHILHFNERIWLDGEDVGDAVLESAHQRLLRLLLPEDAAALSYFEYTTLLAIIIYEKCDYVLFEAGLGGEHDATSVFANILTLITPIDRDHEAFLGDTVEKIATTKLKAIQKSAIFAKQHHTEVKEVANKLSLKRGFVFFDAASLLDEDDFLCRDAVVSKELLTPYLVQNLTLAMAALKFLGVAFDATMFEGSRLFGRLSTIAPNITLDVGHNALAASGIVAALAPKRYTLIYNSYKDKDYAAILKILSPIIKSVEIIDVDEARIAPRELLESTLRELGVAFSSFESLDAQKEYLVFGSFSVAQRFLEHYKSQTNIGK